MSWNYRVVEVLGVTGDKHYEIRAVYYNDNGKIEGYGEPEGSYPFGDSAEELKDDLHMMLDAFNKPVLNIEDLPKEKK